VLKAYQQLTDEELVEKRRGLGMFVRSGARDVLMRDERDNFLRVQWPQICETIRRLGLTPVELLAAVESAGTAPAKAGKR
jgi:GntR family transcriptional regulator